MHAIRAAASADDDDPALESYIRQPSKPYKMGRMDRQITSDCNIFGWHYISMLHSKTPKHSAYHSQAVLPGLNVQADQPTQWRAGRPVSEGRHVGDKNNHDTPSMMASSAGSGKPVIVQYGYKVGYKAVREAALQVKLM